MLVEYNLASQRAELPCVSCGEDCLCFLCFLGGHLFLPSLMHGVWWSEGASWQLTQGLLGHWYQTSSRASFILLHLPPLFPTKHHVDIMFLTYFCLQLLFFQGTMSLSTPDIHPPINPPIRAYLPSHTPFHPSLSPSFHPSILLSVHLSMQPTQPLIHPLSTY